MKKNTDFSADAAIWLDFSIYDLKTAKWDLKGKIYTSACYGSQQAAEKGLKALLLSKGKVIPKVHSLDRLISELKKAGVKTLKFKKSAQLLDKYYISTRYPGQFGGPEGLYNQDDAESAITAAEEILNIVKKQIT